MQSSYSEQYTPVVRRPLDIEDYLDILRRHKGWIAGPLFTALVLGVVVAFLWPDRFVSVASIRVVPQQVPENYVPTNINVQMSQRINAMYQTISSSTTLTNIVNLYNLYPKERLQRPIADIVEQMKGDIRVSNVVSVARSNHNDVSAFSITFQYYDRVVAQKVCQDLVGRFMTENARERNRASVQTTQFLQDQVENAKRRLDAIESKLASFRQTYQGRLPDQIQQNTMQLSMLEQRIANANNSLARISQEKLMLESDLRSYTTQRASLVPAPEMAAQRQKNEALVQIDRDILKLEADLAVLSEHYKPNYPDVRRVQARLDTARKMREKMEKDEERKQAEAAAAPASARRPDGTFDREARALDAAMERAQAQIKAKDLEAEQYRKDIQRTETQIRTVQGRIEASPASEQQYAEVVRDRDAAKLAYDNLSKNLAQSSMAEDLERRQQGETLEILEQASLPLIPTYPPRPLIVGAGAALGLVLGLVLAGVREAKDTSLKNLKDVRAYTQLTILGSVPLLENDLVVRRRRRLVWLAWSTACLLGIVIMIAAVFYYYATKT